MNALARAAGEHHRAWARHFGLVRGEAAIARHRAWRAEDVAAMWYLHAEGDELNLGADIFGWFLLFDDQFDGPRGESPEAAAQVIDEVIGAMAPGAAGRAGLSPAAAAFADLWARERQGMSPAWRERAERNWREYLRTYVAEAENRRRRAALSVREYMALRDKSGVMYVLLDTLERVGRYEVPGAIYQSAELRGMYDVCVQTVNVVNDVLSLAKEEARGDPHNLVLVLERERRCDRAAAIGEVQAMVRGWTDQFLAAEASLPRACDRLGLAIKDRTAVYQFVEGMRAAIRGNYDWCAQTPRYSQADLRPEGEPAYLEDIATPAPLAPPAAPAPAARAAPAWPTT